MANPSKKKGTNAEVKVVEWLRSQGEATVERRALAGVNDTGDIAGLPALCVSVKYRAAGQPLDLSGWLNGLGRMRANVGEPLPAGLLVVSRPRYGDVGDWYAVQPLSQWWSLYRETVR